MPPAAAKTAAAPAAVADAAPTRINPDIPAAPAPRQATAERSAENLAAPAAPARSDAVPAQPSRPARSAASPETHEPSKSDKSGASDKRAAEPARAEATPAAERGDAAPVRNPAGHPAHAATRSEPTAAPGAEPLPPTTLVQPLQVSTAAATPQPPLTASVATSAPVPLNQLGVQIAASVQQGASRFEIRLDPAELGRIDVRIDVDRHGQVTSHLTVEKPETLAMLRQDATHLQRALDDAGLKTGDNALQFSLRDQTSSGGQNANHGDDRNPRAARLVIHEEDPAPAPVLRSYGRLSGASGGIDIRV